MYWTPLVIARRCTPRTYIRVSLKGVLIELSERSSQEKLIHYTIIHAQLCKCVRQLLCVNSNVREWFMICRVCGLLLRPHTITLSDSWVSWVLQFWPSAIFSIAFCISRKDLHQNLFLTVAMSCILSYSVKGDHVYSFSGSHVLPLLWSVKCCSQKVLYFSHTCFSTFFYPLSGTRAQPSLIDWLNALLWLVNSIEMSHLLAYQVQCVGVLAKRSESVT